MVNILPENPSFGRSFAQGLGTGLSQGVLKSMDYASKLGLQKQKAESENKFINQLLGNATSGQSSQQGLSKASSTSNDPFMLSPEQETILALQEPQKFNAYKHLKEERGKVKEKEVLHKDLGNVLNQLSSTLQEGRLGLTPKKYLTAEGRRDKQYFDSLGVQLESIAKDMISKGVLARDRFAYLLGNLPSSDKTDAANAGAIEAWSDELKIPRPKGLESLYKSEKSSKNKGPLDLETMQKIYKKTGGDREKAKQVAIKMGYDIE